MGLYAWGVPNAKEMNVTQTNDATNDLPLTCDGRSASQPEAGGRSPRSQVKGLPAGTLVVCTLDGEAGRVVEPATYNRNHTKTTSYVVLTDDGREVWDVADIVLPAND